ncbi:MAG TPA: hypothetical protein VER17_12080 [Tepidisphaeraceae bacterium]|nr:hypothetical protein [Tepidisphaeraceae bacterium]
MDHELRNIRFACTCSVVLEVPVERAGTSLQCPQCGRLVDVPTLSDLASLSEDGTYLIDEADARDEPDRLEKLTRAFSRQRTDAHGNEIDLRERFGEDDPEREPAGEIETLEEAGDDDDEGNPVLAAQEEALDVLAKHAFEPPPPPRYDPETGELLRPLPLQQEPIVFDPSTVPMAKAVINYAGADVSRGFRAWQIVPELFRFTNLFVMGLIFATHVFLQMMMFPLVIGMWLILPGFFFLCGALVAHYANVVNDVGYDQKDELPRPLRDLSWTDDIWGPFVHGMTALFVCYGALMFTDKFTGVGKLAFAGTVVILGTIGFPAVFLTTTSSGTVLNLMPDRLLRVMGALGPKYLIAVALWAASAVVYLAGNVATIFFLSSLLSEPGATPNVIGPELHALLGYGLLMLGIVMMHGFCWYLGLQYRGHHEQFNWLLQRHHKKVDLIRPKYGFATLSGESGAKVRPKRASPQNHA